MGKRFYLQWMPTVFMLLLCNILFAQLSVKQTRWNVSAGTGSGEKRILQFNNDTLFVKSVARTETVSFMHFLQRQDTLMVFNSVGKDVCSNDTGFYHIIYQNSGQHLFLKTIKDRCGDRSKLFSQIAPFNFISDKNSAARDWLALDPATDSIAGISLYKAYTLLKGRTPKRIIVAVIDNGFDLAHEDLKNIFWTNTKEIPGNSIDDDHNGYTDDVDGWNFRSDKKGNIIENEQAGATQIYAAWKGKYGNTDTGHLSADEKKEWAIFKEARSEYFEKLRNSKDTTEIKYTYNVDHRSSDLIGDDLTDPSNRNYGSPIITYTPNLSHGTHVAGIIAAQRNNGKGIDGIADNVRIMPIIASTGSGDERDKDVANAIRYAVKNGAKVINMSFSKRYSPDKKLVDEAIRYAEEKHVLIIHTAGNDGNNDDSLHYYPIATYNNGKKATNFINVGWNRPLFNYRLAHPNSGYGKKNVDLFAPGSDIFSTVPGNSYDYKSGSSMSAPCVSGVAALLFSYFPSLSMLQVKEILLRSTFKPDVMVNKPGSKVKVPFSSLSVSGGILNAYNAVKMAIAITEKKRPN